MNWNRPKGRNAGLTLVEIIISMLVLAMIMAGLANLFVAVKRHTLHARCRMAAGELGRYFLDNLQMHVRQDTWSNCPVGNQPPPPSTNIGNLIGLVPRDYKSTNIPLVSFPQYAGFTDLVWLEEPCIDRINYYPVYEIRVQDGLLRKVKLTINWIEPAL